MTDFSVMDKLRIKSHHSMFEAQPTVFDMSDSLLVFYLG